MNLNKVFMSLKKSWFMKSLCSLLVGIISIISLCYINIAKENVSIHFDVQDQVIVNSILINNNDVLGTENNFLELKNNNNEYVFTSDFTLVLNKLDTFKISYDNRYQNHIKVYDDKIIIKSEDENIIITNNINEIQLLQEYLQNNLLKSICLFLPIVLFVYILLSIINNFISNIKQRFSLVGLILSIVSFFLILYLNFYTLVYLFNYWMVGIFLLPLIYFFKNFYKKKIEFYKIFIIILSYLSLIIMFSVPPFNVPDEGNHFAKVYNNLFYFTKTSHQNGKIEMDQNTYKFYSENAGRTLDISFKISPNIYFEKYNLRVSEDHDYLVDCGTIGTSNFAYIPANIAVQICKSLKTSVLFMFMIGRLATFMCYILLCYFALKTTPKFKYAFALIMILPVTIQQSIGINQDCLNNAFVFAGIAFLFKLLFKKEKIDKKDIILLLLLYFGLARCKIIYTISILLFLLINNKKLKKPIKTKIFVISLVLFMTLISYFKWSGIMSLLGFTNNNAIATTNYYSIKDLIVDPIHTIKIYFNTANSRLTLDLFGGLYNGFGWAKVWFNNSLLSFIISNILMVLIITLPYENIGNKKSKIIFKIGIAILSVLFYFVIGLGLLTGWTIKGSDMIFGLQCRYYIPLVLLIYIFINNNFINYNGKRYNLFFLTATTFIVITSILIMVGGFYV